jgi:hypothetical protein
MDFYLRKRDQYRRERDDERGRMLAAAKVKIARNMPQEAISNLGRRFVALVLQNYQDERITLLDASDYLGVRAEKVRKVEELASGW